MIQMHHVSKAFKGQTILDGVDLEVETGKINVIIGRSGGGKSVLLKHMIGLIKPDAGQIIVDGIDIVPLDDSELNRVRQNFGMLFQDAALFDSMTVGENVAFPLAEHTGLSRREIERIVDTKLKQVGLPDISHKLPAELSGGMRKRVGLARAIALDPKIILFDEPTTGLDPIMTDAIDQLIVDTQSLTGATFVVISHDIPSTFRIAHNVAMLYQGKIIISGPPDRIRSCANPAVRNFIGGRLPADSITRAS